MNHFTKQTTTASNGKPRSEFTALIEFKKEHLMYGKFKTYDFRSDRYTASNKPFEQYLCLESLIENHYKNQFVTATIFDNRLHFSSVCYVLGNDIKNVETIIVPREKTVVKQWYSDGSVLDNSLFFEFFPRNFDYPYSEKFGLMMEKSFNESLEQVRKNLKQIEIEQPYIDKHTYRTYNP